MYVLKTDSGYVSFDNNGSNHQYAQTLVEAQRFPSINALLNALQAGLRGWYASLGMQVRPGFGVLSSSFTIEKVTEKTVWIIRNRGGGGGFVKFLESGSVDFTALERYASKFDTEEAALEAIQRWCAKARYIISGHLSVEGIIDETTEEVR
jgi:hypothetical protein